MAIVRIPIELSNPYMPSPAVNVWHARMDDGTMTDPGPILDALKTFYTSLSTYFAGGTVISFPESVVNVETSEEVTPATVPADITVTGSSKAPPGDSVVVSWKTSLRARRGRGRTFLGPLTNGIWDSTSGRLGAPATTAITNAGNALLTSSQATNGWALGVYGQVNTGVAEPKILRDFTGLAINTKGSYLRSRRD